MKKPTKEEYNREQNKKYKTLIKNDRKRIIAALASKSVNEEGILALYRNAQSNLDKSAVKKIIHKNSVARKKSSLSRILNSVSN